MWRTSEYGIRGTDTNIITMRPITIRKIAVIIFMFFILFGDVTCFADSLYKAKDKSFGC